MAVVHKALNTMPYEVMFAEHVQCRKAAFKPGKINYRPRLLEAANKWKDVTCQRCLKEKPGGVR